MEHLPMMWDRSTYSGGIMMLEMALLLVEGVSLSGQGREHGFFGKDRIRLECLLVLPSPPLVLLSQMNITYWVTQACMLFYERLLRKSGADKFRNKRWYPPLLQMMAALTSPRTAIGLQGQSCIFQQHHGKIRHSRRLFRVTLNSNRAVPKPSCSCWPWWPRWAFSDILGIQLTSFNPSNMRRKRWKKAIISQWILEIDNP